jgi:hypothetical protein
MVEAYIGHPQPPAHEHRRKLVHRALSRFEVEVNVKSNEFDAIDLSWSGAVTMPSSAGPLL